MEGRLLFFIEQLTAVDSQRRGIEERRDG
jgi:hypothetical protein